MKSVKSLSLLINDNTEVKLILLLKKLILNSKDLSLKLARLCIVCIYVCISPYNLLKI